ncbi:hypothetical protein [Aliiroseovarius sp. 2305UL8-7]|uniref:hypothetical protein n=1 Tax=Aliiroseovarius conchicola TaxID=3121637 RepID=UPI0035277772
MFHKLDTDNTRVQAFEATGTILAGDVHKLFTHGEADLSEGTRLSILIGADFDGYLSELAKGLAKELKRADLADVKCAVILPDGMVQEAALAHVTTDGEELRAFGVSTRQAAQDWLAD